MADVRLQSQELDTRDDEKTVVSDVNHVNESNVDSNTDLIADVNLLSISENNVHCDDVGHNKLYLNSTLSSLSSQCKPSSSYSSNAVNNCELTEDVQEIDGVKYVCYKNEQQMKDIMRLIQKDLSEPYSIYTYRYFIHNWPKLCFLVSYTRTSIYLILKY
jgi:peptide alpha-N-acetyltransferase